MKQDLSGSSSKEDRKRIKREYKLKKLQAIDKVKAYQKEHPELIYANDEQIARVMKNTTDIDIRNYLRDRRKRNNSRGWKNAALTIGASGAKLANTVLTPTLIGKLGAGVGLTAIEAGIRNRINRT